MPSKTFTHEMIEAAQDAVLSDLAQLAEKSAAASVGIVALEALLKGRAAQVNEQAMFDGASEFPAEALASIPKIRKLRSIMDAVEILEVEIEPMLKEAATPGKTAALLTNSLMDDLDD